jgi:hypothetical protein
MIIELLLPIEQLAKERKMFLEIIRQIKWSLDFKCHFIDLR